MLFDLFARVEQSQTCTPNQARPQVQFNTTPDNFANNNKFAPQSNDTPATDDATVDELITPWNTPQVESSMEKVD
uniref:Uncharacterized protein n=1 Tax=Ditylenchus dipsaci TaxID=166011 RepID=A0A915DCE9_9BILA